MMRIRRLYYMLKNQIYNLHNNLSIATSVSLHSRVVLKGIGSGRIVIGEKSCLSDGCYMAATPESIIEIGNCVYFNRHCEIVSHEKVVIGDNTIFGPGVRIFDHNHVFNKTGVKNDFSTKCIEIGKCSWIGAGCILLKNAKIGDHCVIGAGIIVDFDVPDYSIVSRDKTCYTIKQMRD